ncbi:MAG: BlaI/MecI/CopY family transcriptional regulator [Paenibacillaceae bacterium]|jgi:predicted transcriptional regulator|nr:BlaI/MecI/CopY family transcriptional regulator [Paenibacillaceae bacterium]
MKFNLSKTELEIMNLLWNKKQWLSGAEFWEYFNNRGKSSKRQTINTYLTRMVDKGILVKNDKLYMYAYTKEEFDRFKAKEILDTMYEGSFKKFVTALSGNDKITSEEAIELKEYLDKLE